MREPEISRWSGFRVCELRTHPGMTSGEYIPDNSLRQLRFSDPAIVGTMISLNEPSRGPLHDMLRVGKQGEQA
jgi:hypothetical protein